MDVSMCQALLQALYVLAHLSPQRYYCIAKASHSISKEVGAQRALR